MPVNEFEPDNSSVLKEYPAPKKIRLPEPESVPAYDPPLPPMKEEPPLIESVLPPKSMPREPYRLRIVYDCGAVPENVSAPESAAFISIVAFASAVWPPSASEPFAIRTVPVNCELVGVPLYASVSVPPPCLMNVPDPSSAPEYVVFWPLPPTATVTGL